MIFEFEDTPIQTARMKVVGVGGAGGNAVNRMVDEDLEGVEFITANTDAQALKGSRAQVTLQVGKKLTRGLAGCPARGGPAGRRRESGRGPQGPRGGRPGLHHRRYGWRNRYRSRPNHRRNRSRDGCANHRHRPKPFSFEGKKRERQAEQGLAELRRTVDTMIVVPNDRLLSVVPRGTSFRNALKKADEVLLHATQGISDLIRVSGEVNVDFADVRTVMACRGPALMGSGFGAGDNRAQEAAQEAVSSPCWTMYRSMERRAF